MVLVQGRRQGDTRIPLRIFSDTNSVNNLHCIASLLTVSVIVLLRVVLIIKVTAGFTDVVHSPERFQSRWEGFSDKVIITVSIAFKLLGRIVHTGVSGVLGRILFLADI